MKIKLRKERQKRRNRRRRRRRERSVIMQATAAEMAIPNHLLVPHQKQSVLDASDTLRHKTLPILCSWYVLISSALRDHTSV